MITRADHGLAAWALTLGEPVSLPVEPAPVPQTAEARVSPVAHHLARALVELRTAIRLEHDGLGST